MATMRESDLHRKPSVVDNKLLCPDHYRLVMKEERLSGASQPGQFVNLKINNREELLLRRPFSIARTQPEKSLFEIVYRVVGKGTEAMTGLQAGDTLDSTARASAGDSGLPMLADTEIFYWGPGVGLERADGDPAAKRSPYLRSIPGSCCLSLGHLMPYLGSFLIFSC